jgi:hypothetical protein
MEFALFGVALSIYLLAFVIISRRPRKIIKRILK